MIVACPNCATRYEVPETAFRGAARRLRCRACMFEWWAVPDDAEAGEAAAGGGREPDPELARHLEDAARLERNLAAMAERPPVRDIETAAREPEADAAPGRRSSPAAGLVALAATIALVIGGGFEYRDHVVRIVPAAAALYELAGIAVNVRGMEFANVVVERQFDNGLPVLAVKGEIVNVSERTLEVPRLRFGLRDGSAHEIYHWTMAIAAERLEPAGRARFTTKLAAPPQEARDVVVRFHDLGPRRAAIGE